LDEKFGEEPDVGLYIGCDSDGKLLHPGSSTNFGAKSPYIKLPNTLLISGLLNQAAEVEIFEHTVKSAPFTFHFIANKKLPHSSQEAAFNLHGEYEGLRLLDLVITQGDIDYIEKFLDVLERQSNYELSLSFEPEENQKNTYLLSLVFRIFPTDKEKEGYLIKSRMYSYTLIFGPENFFNILENSFKPHVEVIDFANRNKAALIKILLSFRKTLAEKEKTLEDIKSELCKPIEFDPISYSDQTDFFNPKKKKKIQKPRLPFIDHSTEIKESQKSSPMNDVNSITHIECCLEGYIIKFEEKYFVEILRICVQLFVYLAFLI